MRVTSILLATFSLTLWTAAAHGDLLSDPRARADDQVRLYWIDDHRILYRGFSEEQLAAMKNGKFNRYTRELSRTLYIADVRSGAVKRYAVVDSDNLCFSKDAILYSKNRVHWQGPFGSEKARPDFRPHGYETLSRSRCAYLPLFSGSLEVKNPARNAYLEARHGHIEMRPVDPSRNSPVQLYLWRPAAKEGIRLPGITLSDAQNLSNGDVTYSDFKGAYFFYSPGVSGSVPNRAWWLFPDGKIQRVSIPEGPWNRSSRTNAVFVPVRDGLLIQMRRPADSRYIYLLPSAAAGYAGPNATYDKPVWRLAVSPNGCKVAIETPEAKSSFGSPLLIDVIDLCAVWKH